MASSLAQDSPAQPEGADGTHYRTSVDFSAPASPPTAGLTLPQRGPSVTLHRRESSDVRERQASTSRRDSLEDTKSFVSEKARLVTAVLTPVWRPAYVATVSPVHAGAITRDRPRSVA